MSNKRKKGKKKEETRLFKNSPASLSRAPPAPTVFVEHHALSRGCTVFEHSLQNLSIHIDKQAAGLVRMSIRYNQVRKMLVNIADTNHVHLFLHLKTVPLLSHVDAKQVANQRHSARASNTELHDEDIVSHQRCHDLSRIDGQLPNAAQYGACLTLRISVKCSTETMINMLSRLSKKIAHHGDVAYCHVVNRKLACVDWRIENEICDLPLSQLSSFDIQYGLYALFSWSDEVRSEMLTSRSQFCGSSQSLVECFFFLFSFLADRRPIARQPIYEEAVLPYCVYGGKVAPSPVPDYEGHFQSHRERGCDEF